MHKSCLNVVILKNIYCIECRIYLAEPYFKLIEMIDNYDCMPP